MCSPVVAVTTAIFPIDTTKEPVICKRAVHLYLTGSITSIHQDLLSCGEISAVGLGSLLNVLG